MKYSINNWLFGPLSIEEMARYAKEIGVDGMDVSGEPDSTDCARVKKVMNDSGLEIFCVNGNFLAEDRAFSHGAQAMREKAAGYGKRCVDMAAALGTDKVLIVPSQVNRGSFFVSREQDWENAVETLRTVADYAKQHGVTVMLECVNKYEVMMVKSLADGMAMAKESGRANVKVIGDTFHMQLEESAGIPAAIRRAGAELVHFHLGDNTRAVPGRGTLPWREILLALKDAGYNGALSFEPFPNGFGPEEIFKGAFPPADLAKELKFSLGFLKAVEQGI